MGGGPVVVIFSSSDSSGLGLTNLVLASSLQPDRGEFWILVVTLMAEMLAGPSSYGGVIEDDGGDDPTTDWETVVMIMMTARKSSWTRMH